jgi:hypothetical protein
MHPSAGASALGGEINLNQVFDGQKVGITAVGDKAWLASFIPHEAGFFE